MGFRFRKSFGKGPFRVTVSKSGVGYSVGGKGFRYTKKAGGGTRTTASIPGTGISYVKDSGSGKTRSTSSGSAAHNVSNPDTASLNQGYCVHCYRILEPGTIQCPACGKSQFERVKQSTESKEAMWCTICLIAGFVLMKSAGFISFVLLIVGICLALDLSKKKKQGFSTTINAAPAGPSAKPMQESSCADTKNIISQSVPVSIPAKETSPSCKDSSVPVSKPDTPSSIAKTYNVTGIQHYMDNILSLSYDNPDYEMSKREIIDAGMTDEKIWEYGFYGKNVEVVPEPDNPYDPKAIKVIIDGKHVGYIKSGACPHLLKVINENRIRRILCTIGGGRYKEVYEDEDNDTFKIERGEKNYSIKLTVYEIVK